MTLSLYIHVPYCLEKCPYCDFHSIATPKREIAHAEYADLLVSQLRAEVGRLGLDQRPLLSVFFGGGTPSLMNEKFFETVLRAVAKEFSIAKDIEITVETNPATASKENFRNWLHLGINRVSFGVQSFQDPFLKKLGRNHSAEEAILAIQSAKEAGFQNASCDLIFGIEGQTLKCLEKDLGLAYSMGLPHLSAYQLTVEPGTPLASWVAAKKFFQPEEEILVQMHQLTADTFGSRGLKRYEISNYALPGFESRHNLQYWRYGEYLGLGSGAVSCVGGKRWRTTRKLKEYFAKNFQQEENSKTEHSHKPFEPLYTLR
ncbi:MAG: radical SAM family heme chaperone HemW [Deltaproteobacteria bacterium]|nr:radical SAM family heme chaperone HemW [Deltaproteobacteria bacterium]